MAGRRRVVVRTGAQPARAAATAPPPSAPADQPPAPSPEDSPVDQRLLGTQPLPVVAVTGSADVDVDLTNGGRMQYPAKVKVGNLSGIAWELTMQGHVDHLRPSETNVFETRAATNLHLRPIAGGPNPGSLLMAVAPEGLDFPGTYPFLNERPTLGNQQLSGSPFTIPLDGATHTNDVTLLPGTQALALVFFTAAAGGAARNLGPLSVTGRTTQANYVPANASTLAPIMFVHVLSAADSKVGIGVGTNNVGGGATATMTVVAIMDPELVTLSTQQAGYVTLVDFTGALLSTTGGSTNLLRVTLDQANPALWQAPFHSVKIAATLANAAKLTLVSAIALQSVYAYKLNLGLDATVAAGTGGIDFQDTNNFAYHSMEPNVLNPQHYDAGGGPVSGAAASGVGAQLQNNTGSSVTIRGSFTYNQG